MKLVETPEQELQHMIGRLVWENTALRYENAALRKALEEKAAEHTGEN